eukprot:15443616-Alexandrium_andersonii.AAC.1
MEWYGASILKGLRGNFDALIALPIQLDITLAQNALEAARTRGSARARPLQRTVYELLLDHSKPDAFVK